MTTGPLPASVRLVRQLNALTAEKVGTDPAAAVVVGSDVAHHVLDPDGVAGLDPLHATPLADALHPLARRSPSGWALLLPVPGRLGGLRGPVTLNQAAIGAGAVAIGVAGGLALVPRSVGPAVQWRVFPAEPPLLNLSSYEAERALSEAILTAGQVLARLDVAAGPGPADVDADLGPAPGYPPRRLAAADRAARLLLACDHALDSDGGSLSSYEMASRRRQIEAVRDAARDALVAAVGWPAAHS